MRIGLTYDLKAVLSFSKNAPDDAAEEYDSPETVDAIAAAIESEGHSTVRLGGGRSFLRKVLEEKVDFVFNISEGLGNYRSREAQVPSVLEMLDIPYVGSDPQCLAVCLDKPLAKKLAGMAGINTPKWLLVRDENDVSEINHNGLAYPALAKPAQEGSSKGIRLTSRVESPRQAASVVGEMLARYRQPVMLEEFLSGDEVTVGVVGNTPPRIVGMMRILPRKKTPNFIYSLEVKRNWEELVDYEAPARLEPHVTRALEEFTLKGFEVLGCRDFARFDYRLGSDGTPYFLEVNPLPGLNPRTSDLIILARKMGWEYNSLILTILHAGLERYQRAAA